MIIRSIFRRYEKWNPVHPTYGAFWGIGVGIGCGIGWGPGCGAGFNVGLTFLGLGIGLPAKYLIEVPHNAVMVTTRGAMDAARAGALLSKRGLEGDDWGRISSQISEILHNPYAPLSGFKSSLATTAKPITDGVQRAMGHFFPSDGGPKN